MWNETLERDVMKESHSWLPTRGLGQATRLIEGDGYMGSLGAPCMTSWTYVT